MEFYVRFTVTKSNQALNSSWCRYHALPVRNDTRWSKYCESLAQAGDIIAGKEGGNLHLRTSTCIIHINTVALAKSSVSSIVHFTVGFQGPEDTISAVK